jgi:HAD superfamily hydrolase (TIGR01509 family)
MIRALIFDFDGLILETEGPIFQSWLEVYHSFGQELSFAAWSQGIGASLEEFDPRLDLQKRLGIRVDWENIEQKRMAREISLIEEQSTLPGVDAYLDTARQLGLKLGIASSSTCQWVLRHLTSLNLVDYFDCIRAADDVNAVKPDPELYLAVMDELKINANEAIAFEDSPNGILAAKRAGLFCVAVPNQITSLLSLGEADIQLSSLAEMPLEQLLVRVSSA